MFLPLSQQCQYSPVPRSSCHDCAPQFVHLLDVFQNPSSILYSSTSFAATGSRYIRYFAPHRRLSGGAARGRYGPRRRPFKKAFKKGE